MSGYILEASEGLDIRDIERRYDLARGELALVEQRGELYIVYLSAGG